MMAKLGRKLMQGASAELSENPPAILDSDRILDIAEKLLTLGLLALTVCWSMKSGKTPTTIVNNIYINGIKQV